MANQSKSKTDPAAAQTIINPVKNEKHGNSNENISQKAIPDLSCNPKTSANDPLVMRGVMWKDTALGGRQTEMERKLNCEHFSSN